MATTRFNNIDWFRVRRRVDDEVETLERDGWRVIFRASLARSYNVSLVHSRKANRMRIVGFYADRQVIYSKNHVVVKTEQL